MLPEVKRYLGGIDNRELDDRKPDSQELDNEILPVISEVIQISRPQFLVKVFPITVSDDTTEICITDSNICIKSNDLAKLLHYSSECGIVAVTLGFEVDRKTAYYGKTDLSRAIIFDAAASAYVEAVCDQKQQEFEQKYLENHKKFTFRFAPGYGDLSLNVQPILLQLLNASVKIGISCSKFFTLYPRKSMTGIFGIVETGDNSSQAAEKPALFQRPKKIDHPKCHTCLNYNHCIYLSEGEYCEYRKQNL